MTNQDQTNATSVRSPAASVGGTDIKFGRTKMRIRYAAMLAAAPQSPSSPDDKVTP